MNEPSPEGIAAEMFDAWREDLPDRATGGAVPWFGGKGQLKYRILELIPRAQVYVEPYFGAGSIFFACDRAACEVINDLDGEIVNFYRVLQAPDGFAALARRLALTAGFAVVFR